MIFWTFFLKIWLWLNHLNRRVLKWRLLGGSLWCVLHKLMLLGCSGISGIIFCQFSFRDTFQHLFGEDTQQLPTDVQSLEDCSVLIVTWNKKKHRWVNWNQNNWHNVIHCFRAIRISWIPWNLLFRYIDCTGQFTPKMKANAESRLLSSLVWIDSGVLVSQHRLESLVMK